MCSGAALLYKIPTIVIGEHTTFRGPEDYLRSRGVELVILDSEECISLVRDFIAAKAAVWNEDIGQE
jgi:creatinine deaminase